MHGEWRGGGLYFGHVAPFHHPFPFPHKDLLGVNTAAAGFGPRQDHFFSNFGFLCKNA